MTQRTVDMIELGPLGTGRWSNLLNAKYAVVGFDVDRDRVEYK